MLSDELLLKVHRKGLEAMKVYSSPAKPDKEAPEYTSPLKAAEIVRQDFGLINTNNQGSVNRCMLT